jgi:hypothetical protein
MDLLDVYFITITFVAAEAFHQWYPLLNLIRRYPLAKTVGSNGKGLTNQHPFPNSPKILQANPLVESRTDQHRTYQPHGVTTASAQIQ